jgi:plastocyanin
MRRIRTFMLAAAIGLAGPVIPVYAGGGVGGGGGFTGSALMEVGNVTPPGHNYAPLDFFPRTLTVHQGDVVTFHYAPDPNALHTVTLVPGGAKLTDQSLNQLLPGAGAPLPDKDDGPGKIAFNFNVSQAAGCGNSPYYPGTGPCTFTGKRVLNSGFLVPAANPQTGKLVPSVPLPSYSVRFNAAPGAYRFFCLVHGPSMSGTVTVVPASAPTTSAVTANARAAHQYQVGVSNAIATESKIHRGPTPGTLGHANFVVQAGSQYGRQEMDQFYPAQATIKVGDTVTFTPGGFHTVTFPPSGPAIAPACEAAPRDRPFTGRFAGCTLEVALGPGAFPSGTPTAYAGGHLTSGILVIPKPHVFTVTFTKAGIYHYVCLVHARMGGTVVVH